MELSKIQISKLDSNNWISWKYRMSALLRGMDGLMDIVQGKTRKPEKPTVSGGTGDAAAVEVLAVYNKNLGEYLKLESTALLLITNNITDEALDKVLRFTNPKEVWEELHRLYDGVNEDQLYGVCMEFFQYKLETGIDMATHLSKVKNLWHKVNQEIMKTDEGRELPEVLLICKILGTLPEEYFSFKSSWVLMSKKDRTVDNLTSQLCAHEKALTAKDSESEARSGSMLFVKGTEKRKVKKGKAPFAFKCHICKEVGHFKKDCPNKEKRLETGASTNVMVVLLNATDCIDRDEWYVDNGATHHVTMRSDLFQDFEHFAEPHTVTTADGKRIEALGKGTILMKAKKRKFVMKDVWYVPTVTKNLFSVLAAQDLNPNSLFESRVTTCLMKIKGKLAVTGSRQKHGGLFKLNCKSVQPKGSVLNTLELDTVNKVDTLQLYHERMGHQDKRHVRRIIEKELNLKTKDGGSLCEGCIFGKTHRRKFGVREKATSPGERIHSDVCGPFPPSCSKFKYFVLFKDEYTRYRYVYCMKQKSEVPEKMSQMLAEAKSAGHTIKEILSDNGGEFDNEKVRKELKKYGTQQRLIMPYTPEQNGCSERDNRTIVEMARAMMHAHQELPQVLWAELVNTATYILNRTGPTTVDHKSPFELWFGKKPQIKHLRIIGSTCYAHVPKQSRKKLQKKAVKCKLVGYDNDDGYRLWNEQSNSLIRSRDVNIDEKPLGAESPVNDSRITEIEIPLGLSDPVIQPQVAQNAEDSGSSGTINNDRIHDSNEGVGTGIGDTELVASEDENTEIVDREDVPAEDLDAFDDARSDDLEQSFELGGDIGVEVKDHTHDEIPEREIMEHGRRVLRDRSLLRPPEKLKDYVLNMASCGYQEPSCYKEAIKSSEQDLWEQAMDCEMNSLKENRTWVLVPLPKNRKAIPCKWVYRVKLNADGTVDKFKARLVAKGFRQKKGQDYDQTFSPVARMTTVRAVLSVAASEGMKLSQFDVSTAFLYGSLSDEEIYLRQPEGYDDGTDRVCLLKKSLYGLKQAPRCWNKCILDFFKNIGFKVSEADPCLFIREKSTGKLVIALYVDDGLLAGTSQELIDEFINELKGRFDITTKPISYYLGLEINVREGDIRVHQTSYVQKILRRFGMQDCRPVSTPVVKESVVSEKAENNDDYFLINYRQVVGALAYLMVGTRPDIAYAVSVVSRSLENPTRADCVRLKRILRYLQYTPDMSIIYKRSYKKGILECYSDADHSGDVATGRSTTGVLCLYAGGAVSWLSQRQQSVAISTTEAEIVAASEAARESIWLARLLRGITSLDDLPVLNVDNEAAVRLAENPEFHRRTKHIRTRHFFVRELVTNGELQINRICSELQLADLLTKPMARPRLVKLGKSLGLQRSH